MGLEKVEALIESLSRIREVIEERGRELGF